MILEIPKRWSMIRNVDSAAPQDLAVGQEASSERRGRSRETNMREKSPDNRFGLDIARTLRSALDQTYGNIEIIVVDDGSADRTRHIVESFSFEDSRVRLISTVNRGVAMARNFGIKNARGTYLAFLDADDLWHPTKIERQLQAFRLYVLPDS
jgi:cellulose synthase/poly-beta-1,6-N-acetylglucosamine synthase-like glycosyltransferase